MKKYRGNPWAVLIVVSLGFFMTLLDLTIVNIAIPDMITQAARVARRRPLGDQRIRPRPGRPGHHGGQARRPDRAADHVQQPASRCSPSASAACGSGPEPGWLIAFRAVQGLGAAMLMPQTLTIITNTLPAGAARRRRSASGARWPVWPPSPGRPWAGCW